MKYANAKENAPKYRKETTKQKLPEDQGCKDSRKIHVNGIPREWSNDDIRRYFEQIVCAFFSYNLGRT